jgi:hypothetical protein
VWFLGVSGNTSKPLKDLLQVQDPLDEALHLYGEKYQRLMGIAKV